MRQRGFTLIEVLVALVVIGIAMTAATQSVVTVGDGSIALRRHLAGGWVAQNRLNHYVAAAEFPNPGANQGEESQAGLQFVWRETVSETPNKSFRRVEVKVYAPENPNHADAILVGYIARVVR